MLKKSDVHSVSSVTEISSNSDLKSMIKKSENSEGDTVTLTKDQLASLLKVLKLESDAGSLHQNIKKDEDQLHFPKDVNNDGDTLKKSNNYSDTKLTSKSSTEVNSKSQLKKLQFQNNKEEFQEWNPWGRPGGGAPLKRKAGSTGDLVHFRGQSPSWSHTDSNGCRFGTPVTTTVRDLPQQDVTFTPPIKYIPMAIASSLPFGNAEDAVSLDLYKQENKKCWLRDLEKQREEQRQRKERERLERLNGFSATSSIEDITRFSSLDHLKIPGIQGNDSLHSNESGRTSSSSGLSPLQDRLSSQNRNFRSDVNLLSCSNENALNGKSLNYSSSPEPLPTSADQFRTSPQNADRFLNGNTYKLQGSDGSKWSYARGHNVTLDPDKIAELQERKMKAVKHQQDIQTQIEEKARLKKEEKLRLQREDALAEERFLKQQETLQKQFELEQQKLKDKALAEEEKKKKIFKEMQKAELEAEAEKQSRRKHHLPIESGVITPIVPHPQQLVDVATSVQNTGSTNQAEIPTKFDMEITPSCSSSLKTTQTDEVNITTRILTPTAYRKTGIDANTQVSSREFGTQTDSVEIKEIDKKSLRRKHSNVKNTRTACDKAESCSISSSKSSDNLRPKWGVNKPHTVYIKQSEKDPHYVKKMNAREKRRMKNKIPADTDSTTSTVSADFRFPPQFHYPSLPRLSSKSYNSKNTMRSSSSFPSLNKTWPNLSNSYQHSQYMCELGKSRRKWHSYENFNSHWRKSLPTNCLHPFSPPSSASSPRNRPSLSSLCQCSTTTCTHHAFPPLRKKWIDQGNYHLGMNCTTNMQRSLMASSSDTKAQSADSGYVDDRIKKVNNPELTSMEFNNSTSPVIRSNMNKNSPVPGQDRILQQLSYLRQGLLHKQIELQKLINASKSSGI